VDDHPGLEHQRVGDHRVVHRVGVLLDVQIVLHRPVRVGQEGPPGADRRAKLQQRAVVVGGDRDDLRVRHRELLLERGQIEVLLMLLRAVMAAHEGKDHRITALQFAQRDLGAGVIGQHVIGEDTAGDYVGAHREITSSVRSSGLSEGEGVRLGA
jgi:hypothetical protein